MSETDALFPGFRAVDLDVATGHDAGGDVRVHAVVGGSGPPLLLVHGYPQTHVMWHRIAPALARTHTVVAADLRGYGDSAKPPGDDPAVYAKRAMAADLVAAMTSLGFDRFAVVGHDRGARVTHRLCLDRPDVVTRAAVLDIVPTAYVYDHVDRALAEAYEHWFFLSQPGGLPERLIGADPEYYLRAKITRWSAEPAAFDERAVAEYVRCFRDPAAVPATCADYRAGASVDLDHAAADRAAGRLVRNPLLVLWGADGFVGRRYDVLDVWRAHHAEPGLVTGRSLPGGHFVAEESPEATLAALQEFLAAA